MSDIICDGLVLEDGSKVYVRPPIADANNFGGIKATAITSSTINQYTEDVLIDTSGHLKTKKVDTANLYTKTEGQALRTDLTTAQGQISTLSNKVKVTDAFAYNETGKTVGMTSGYSFNIPMATSSIIGGILADAATADDTGEVRITNKGKLRFTPTKDSTKADKSEVSALATRVSNIESTYNAKQISNIDNINKALYFNGTTVGVNTGYKLDFLPNLNGNEVATGQTWFGDPIYMKSFHNLSVSVSEGDSQSLNGKIDNIKEVIDIRGAFKTNTPVYTPLPYIAPNGKTTRVYVDESGVIKAGGGTGDLKGTVNVTVYYTKN